MLAQKIPFYRERHFVKPGFTGWGEICYPYGSSEQDVGQELDDPVLREESPGCFSN